MKKISETNFTTYHNHRTEPYFTFVKNGQKTIEGRIRKGKYQFIKPGDRIIVYNNQETESVEVFVKRVQAYISIKEMLEKEPIKKILPDVETIEQGLEKYKQFYTDEQQKKFGVVAIEVERIKV
ncbi:MAG: ASCH domain-containing protein [Candidatus Paceibacterota bacterium]|jgi:ASC-1-like (ASCH) protein